MRIVYNDMGRDLVIWEAFEEAISQIVEDGALMRLMKRRYLGGIFYVVLLATAGLAHAQASVVSNVEANRLFVEAVMLYRQATALPASVAPDRLNQVRRLFDRILVNHPDSLPGQAIRDGGSPGGVDLTVLPPTPPAGWNEGKRGIARDLLKAYGGKLEELERVADATEYALLAWAAYGDKDVIDSLGEAGWYEHLLSRDNHFVEPSTLGGGDAVARLFVSERGEAALAFRGTTTKKDWLTNAGTVLPIYSDQLRSARVLADRARALYPDVTFVGHSLGGAMAQVARLHTGQVALIFNSAPMGLHELGMAISGEPLDREVNSALLAFRSPEDPVREVSEDISGFEDLVVRNVALTNNTVFRNVLDGIAGTGHAHTMPVLAEAMAQVALARDERWLYAYLLEQSGLVSFAGGHSDTEPNKSDGEAAIIECERQFITVSVGESKCGYSLDRDGIVKFQEKNVFRFDQVSADTGYNYIDGERVPAGTNTRIRLFPQSPSGRFHIIDACHYECGGVRLFDSKTGTPQRFSAGKYGPHPYISWGPDGRLAGLFSSNEGYSQIHIVNAQTGKSWAFPNWGSTTSDASSLIIEKESLVWVDPTTFYVDARFCTALKPSQRCYDLERLSAKPTDRVLFRVQADGVNPVVTEAHSVETHDQAVAGSTAPPDSWRGQPSVEQALEDVVTAYSARAFDGCTRAHGPIAPEFRRPLLAKTVLTIVEGGGRRAQQPITNELLDGRSFCLSHNIGECVGYDYQLYYCASGETPFINVASSSVHFRVTNVEPMQKSPWVTGRIDSQVFRTETHRPVEGQDCHISNGWSDVTAVRWSGACENGRVTGRGILEWLKGPEIIWRTRVGPEWGMTLTEGTLRFALDLDTFDFTLDSCNQYNRLGLTGRRTAVVAAPPGKSAEYFENTWIVEQLLSRAAYFAQAECPLLPKVGLASIKVSIRHADGKEIVSGSNSNADRLDWSQVSNSAVTAMSRELAQTERNRIAAERQRAAQVRAQALASEFEGRRKVIEDRARSFIASGQGKIEDLAAALEIDRLGTLGRLERGVTLWLEPEEGVDTVNHEGTRHYRVSYTATPPLAQLEQEFRSKQDFSWENWMTMIQAADPFRRTQLSCLFENVARIPSEARNVSGSLLSFSGSSDSLAISLLCD